MSALAWLTCKAFIECLPTERQKKLLAFLPVDQQEILGALTSGTVNWVGQSIQPEDVLDVVHPSRIIPLLQGKSSQEIGLYLASLQSGQGSILKNSLRFLRPFPSISPIGRVFLRKDLLEKLCDGEEVLPLSVLPLSTLTPVVQLSCQEMARLIYLLGLRDLGNYLRLVIDKTQLRRIEEALTSQELEMVRHLFAKKDPLAAGRASFDAWQGDVQKLRITIEQRGINRLAKAMCEEHPSFLWHIAHKMDISRANFFNKLCREVPSKEIRDLLREQLLQTLKLLQEK